MSYGSPGPVRQYVFDDTLTLGVLGVFVRLGVKVKVGVGVSVGVEVSEGVKVNSGVFVARAAIVLATTRASSVSACSVEATALATSVCRATAGSSVGPLTTGANCSVQPETRTRKARTITEMDFFQNMETPPSKPDPYFHHTGFSCELQP
jgi:hypothetical protein